MKKRLFLLLLGLCLGSIPLALAFQSSSRAGGAEPFTAVLPHPLDSDKMLLASSTRLLEVSKKNPRQKSESVGSLRSRVTKLLSFPSAPGKIFILSEDGILCEDLENKNSELIFRPQRSSGESHLAFAVDPEDPTHFFAGTNEGLFESDDAGKSWFPFYRFKRRAVSLLHFSKDRLFVSTGDTLFSSEDKSFFAPSFFLKTPKEADSENLFSESDPEELILAENGFYEMISSTQGNRLWMATSEGVFESLNFGRAWRRLPDSGMHGKEALYLAYSGSAQTLFVATSKGVYRFEKDNRRWTEIFAASGINGMVFVETPEPVLFILTDQGLSSVPIVPGEFEKPVLDIPAVWKLDLFRHLTLMEPSITQFQKHIIDYNDVKNSKIKRWHAESRIASFLPSLSFGKDFSRANNIDIDRGGTNDRDQFINGPDDIDQGWDFDVSWDLGDFIWSSNQTSIDSREKLMIELRNDLLAESTRIFFERRRLQMEAVMKPSASQEEFMEKLLAIDELTSLLDGMSGGFFIKNLERLYREHPEFERLWEYDSYGVERTAYSGKSNDKKF